MNVAIVLRVHRLAIGSLEPRDHIVGVVRADAGSQGGDLISLSFIWAIDVPLIEDTITTGSSNRLASSTHRTDSGRQNPLHSRTRTSQGLKARG